VLSGGGKKWKSNKDLHRFLPEEERAVLDMARREEYSDLSHRILAMTARDIDLFFVSF
jgi:hypothetical protein